MRCLFRMLAWLVIISLLTVGTAAADTRDPVTDKASRTTTPRRGVRT